jgi:hypothetical protein
MATPILTVEKLKKDQPKIEADYCALIFTPGRIKAASGLMDSDLTGISQRQLMRCGQYFQLMQDTENLKDGEAVQIESFFVHPGANLGIHRMTVDDTEEIKHLKIVDWKKICMNKINQSYLMYNDPFFPSEQPNEVDFNFGMVKQSDVRHNAIEVLIPVQPDDYEPGYRNFSDLDAVKLVKATMHESWIERAMMGEKRPHIASLAEKQKEQILAIRKRKLNG